MTKEMLLVEGESDRTFFVAYCKAYCDGMKRSKIEVFPPKAVGAQGNGWGNALQHLANLVAQLRNGDIERLGIVLDADYLPNGGFAQRLHDVQEKLQASGFMLSTTDNQMFYHPDAPHPIGIWLMPNHQNDGMLEDFVQDLIVDPVQADLLNHAKQSIAVLPTILFNRDLHLAKATVCTWRAWQKEPSASLGQALNNQLLDRSQAMGFENWLCKVFP